jgi:heat shock protein HtpX
MVGALRRLQAVSQPTPLPESMRAFGISAPGGFTRLFMSHPPLEERIAALERAA